MTATAWIIAITKDISVAVGEFELIHLLPDRPVLYALPKAPDYCNKVLVWENKIIPVMDIAKRFNLGTKEFNASENYIAGIFAYRDAKTATPGYGALFLQTTPQRIEVSDEQSCDLPDYFKPFSNYAMACFNLAKTDTKIVVLRLNSLFLPKT